jgi:hypothetical protein
MDKELKVKWLAALRSGDYPQGQGTLRSTEGFCCLGVLCDVIDPNGWELGLPHASTYADTSVRWTDPESGERDRVELPRSVASRAGLPLQIADKLVEFNDEDNWTFSTIADWIEKNL